MHHWILVIANKSMTSLCWEFILIDRIIKTPAHRCHLQALDFERANWKKENHEKKEKNVNKMNSELYL